MRPIYKYIINVAAAFYLVIAVCAFILNLNIGPVTIGLSVLRGLLWPLWMAGMLQGVPVPIPFEGYD